MPSYVSAILRRRKKFATQHLLDYEKWKIGFSRFQFKKRVGPNVVGTVVLMRSIEDKNGETTGQFTARPPTKV